ncbi:hypothetical protein PROFUN_02992 [Planoprotostelium fungivorum]|uniref:Uncharacterized protein n=1 Tax=Planoprotostelium fungivorum TaxID=1890364 RepID=A0A2P6NX98_9EUKA|nr:hypothetical protein PROFUN_02992 [Planoprotostelium fungivorum]
MKIILFCSIVLLAIVFAIPQDASGSYKRGHCKCSRILGRCEPYFDDSYTGSYANGSITMTPAHPDQHFTTKGTFDNTNGNLTLDVAGKGDCTGFWSDTEGGAVMDCRPNYLPLSCHVVFQCVDGPCAIKN